ncbi:MAG: hypothetical protein RL226_1263 [Bacteroidota bacterium]|jgi:hypothetical protein
MKSLAEAQRHIDSIARPNGYNHYAWNVAKRLALEAWECYLTNRPFRRPINFFCQEFYQMLRLPNGSYIVPECKFRRYA